MLRRTVQRFLPPTAQSHSLLRHLFSPGYRRLRGMEKRARRATGGVVAAGPFKGLRYIDRSIGSMLTSKYLGTYEMELEPVINQGVARGYALVIDIGAAEGYYAVGMAWRLPQARVIAFEAQQEHHPLLLELAERNGVKGRITLHGYGTPQLLQEALASSRQRRALVICDVEGFEEELLDPSAVPELQHADVLVELHEFVRPGIGPKLRQRFAATHRITEIHTRPRSLEDWPSGVAMDLDQRVDAMHEGRPGEMSWFWMEALA